LQIWRAVRANHLAATLSSLTMKFIKLLAHDKHPLATYFFEAVGEPIGTIVIAPAMAVAQNFYANFARYLSAAGYQVWTFDYRGTGESLDGSMRDVKANLTDWFELDYDAVLNEAAAVNPTLPLYVIGHSLGGQTAPLLPSRHLLTGLVNIAVGSGAMRHNQTSTRRIAPLLWYVLAPLLCRLFGYFPGSKIGVIGDIPKAALLEWRRWCLSPDYILGGEPRSREAYASAAFPVLALTFSDDELLLEAGSRMLHDAYAQGQVDYRLITPTAVDLKRIGHFGFFKPQCEAMLWPTVTKWLAARNAALHKEN
jgi:predicted alpha/beta hydrolase